MCRVGGAGKKGRETDVERSEEREGNEGLNEGTSEHMKMDWIWVVNKRS